MANLIYSENTGPLPASTCGNAARPPIPGPADAGFAVSWTNYRTLASITTPEDNLCNVTDEISRPSSCRAERKNTCRDFRLCQNGILGGMNPQWN